MKKIYITLIYLVSVNFSLLSQAPNWTVNSSDYETSMSVVAVAVVDGVELSNQNNMIGAFVGDELRGFSTTSYTNSNNQNVAHFLIWSNVGSGETVTFQVYDSDANTVITSVNSLQFSIDGSHGTTADPYIVTNNNNIDDDVVDSDYPLPVNNFISPNNDGYNDYLVIQNIGIYQDFTLMIFNNSGAKVYSVKGYENNWSGISNSGYELASGAYYFSFKNPDNTINFTGSFALVR